MQKENRFEMRLDDKTRENLERLSASYGLSQAAVVRLLVNSTANVTVSRTINPQPKQQAQPVGK